MAAAAAVVLPSSALVVAAAPLATFPIALPSPPSVPSATKPNRAFNSLDFCKPP
jgi:hypothetical protein